MKNEVNSNNQENALGVLWQLEERFMFDGAAASTAVDVVDSTITEAPIAATTEESTDTNTSNEGNLLDELTDYVVPDGPVNEIVFVDTSVDDYETLLADIDPNIQVVLLDSQQDGIEQIARYLAQSQSQSIDASHIISHGDQGELRLGTGVLNLASMQGEYADELAIINQALTADADFLIYGCNFGEGEIGQEAVELLAELTGADIAASNDLTGSAALGGDWDLEVQVGNIEADTFEAVAFQAVLIVPSIIAEDDLSSGDYAGGSGWNGDWIESDGTQDPNAGNVLRVGGQLQVGGGVGT